MLPTSTRGCNVLFDCECRSLAPGVVTLPQFVQLPTLSRTVALLGADGVECVQRLDADCQDLTLMKIMLENDVLRNPEDVVASNAFESGSQHRQSSQCRVMRSTSDLPFGG